MDALVAFLMSGFFGYLFGIILRTFWIVGVVVALCAAPALYNVLVTPAMWFSVLAAALYGMIAGGFKQELLPVVVNAFYWLRNRWEVRNWERRHGRHEEDDHERRGSSDASDDDRRPERRRYEPRPEPESRRGSVPGFVARWGWMIVTATLRGSPWRRRTLRDEVRDAHREAGRLREELELQRREREEERTRAQESVMVEAERLRRERHALEEERRRQQQQARAAPDRRDPYVVLGVRREATVAQIRRVYRALAKAYHEDVAAGVAVEGRMAELNGAMDEIERSRRG